MADYNEEEFILSKFKKNFSQYRKKQIVLYGTGKNTEVILREYGHDFCIAGVMDVNKEGEIFCGKKVLAIEQVKDLCVDLIVMICLPVSENKVSAVCGSGQVTFFQYIPESREELIERRREKGFFNGSTYRKALETDRATDTLKGMIKGTRPFLFARWGEIEGNVVYRMKAGGMKAISEQERLLLERNAGVFPVTESVLKSYCKVMEDAAAKTDILCAFYWQRYLERWIEWYSPDAVIVSSDLEYPFFENPWTAALEGMKVLVVHPFARLIEKQYRNRDKLFRNEEVLPKFELTTYQAVQSMGGCSDYKDWPEALDRMKDDIGRIDFDIALIGCGAYGRIWHESGKGFIGDQEKMAHPLFAGYLCQR